MATTTRKTQTQTQTQADAFAGLFKFPLFDLDAVLEAQKKTIEALVEAQRVAFEGYRAAGEKQAEAVKKALEDMNGATREILNGKTPEVNAQKQVEFVQNFARSGYETIREVSELTLKANRDAFAVIQKRWSETAGTVATEKAA